MNKVRTILLSASIAMSSFAFGQLKTDVDSASYSIGVSLANNFKNQGLQDLDPEIIAKAIKDVFAGKDVLIDEKETNTIIQNFIQNQKKKQYQVNVDASNEFLEKNKKRKEVTTTASGLQYEVLKEGTGEKPTKSDKVTVHYHGTLIDGTVFDSSVDRGSPSSFGVTQVIKGWTEALQLMPVGSKWKVFIPAELAYGANPRPGGKIEPYMALVFEIELISIDK